MANTGETELQDLSLLGDSEGLSLSDQPLDLTLGDGLDEPMNAGVTYAGSLGDATFSSQTMPIIAGQDSSSSSPLGSPAAAAQQIGQQQPDQKPQEAASIFSLAYYQCYFDVSTNDVKDRLLAALLPVGGPFYNDDYGPRVVTSQEDMANGRTVPELVTSSGNNTPDLYGPFWISTTVVFTLAAVGNLSKYLRNFNYGTAQGLDVEKITLAATMFYVSLIVFPVILYFVLRTYSAPRSLVTLISLYGYSFAAYLPAAALSILPGNVASWVSVSIAFTISTLFIVRNVYYLYKNGLYSLPAPGAEGEDERQRIGLFLVIGLVIVHFSIALLTKLYFF